MRRDERKIAAGARLVTKATRPNAGLMSYDHNAEVVEADEVAGPVKPVRRKSVSTG